jgi:aldehyde dehydrogenase (NAD+)
MRDYSQFYIEGRWSDPVEPAAMEVINPANESIAGRISLGSSADVDLAVQAARRAFAVWSKWDRKDRSALLRQIVAEYQKRIVEIADAITEEMGAPTSLSQRAQAAMGLAHLHTGIRVLEEFAFEERRGSTLIVREPIGVCGLITPWNWPINQIACKVVPALATGCTMVLKPSELAPFSACLWAEILHTAGVPAGVFNLVNGDGATVGAALSAHPHVDLVSITGSNRAGIEVARAAAPTVKRVTQELGGKSPYIILADADFPSAVADGVSRVMRNSGQSCNAPTRMLVPHDRMQQAIRIAKACAEKIVVGDPRTNVDMGPVASRAQWNKVQRLIRAGIDEGAMLVTGGLGRPAGCDRGFFVPPTVFAQVTREMTIAREEIFGPVLSILGYGSVEEAIELANDTDYGLAAYVCGSDEQAVRSVASELRAGQVVLNNASIDLMAPFGGYKRSGNGREWGDFGFHEFLEVKALLAPSPASAA